MNDWIELSDGPLDVGAAVVFVNDPSAGGINLFVGTTRADANTSGSPLVALDYESYGEMALEQMRSLAARAVSAGPS